MIYMYLPIHYNLTENNAINLGECLTGRSILWSSLATFSKECLKNATSDY